MLLGIEFPSGRLWSKREISLGLITGVPGFTVRSREHMEYGARGGSLPCSAGLGKCLKEHSQNGANHS